MCVRVRTCVGGEGKKGSCMIQPVSHLWALVQKPFEVLAARCILLCWHEATTSIPGSSNKEHTHIHTHLICACEHKAKKPEARTQIHTHTHYTWERLAVLARTFNRTLARVSRWPLSEVAELRARLSSSTRRPTTSDARQRQAGAATARGAPWDAASPAARVSPQALRVAPTRPTTRSSAPMSKCHR